MSQAELNLDQLLANLADDVPPVPADFHSRWVNAVQNHPVQETVARANADQAEAPAGSPVAQWPRILSIAAVFVFLIGGTFIYRSVRKPDAAEGKSVLFAREETAAETAAAVPERETVREETPAEKAAALPERETDRAEFAAEEFVSEEFAAEEAVVSADMAADHAVPEEAAGAGLAVSNSAGEKIPPQSMPDAGRPLPGASDAPASGAAVNAAEEAPPAAEGLRPAAEDASGPLQDQAAAAPESAVAESRGIGGFFADMGAFLLAVWPYLLIALIPPAVAAAVRISKKSKK